MWKWQILYDLARWIQAVVEFKVFYFTHLKGQSQEDLLLHNSMTKAFPHFQGRIPEGWQCSGDSGCRVHTNVKRDIYIYIVVRSFCRYHLSILKLILPVHARNISRITWKYWNFTGYILPRFRSSPFAIGRYGSFGRRSLGRWGGRDAKGGSRVSWQSSWEGVPANSQGKKTSQFKIFQPFPLVGRVNEPFLQTTLVVATPISLFFWSSVVKMHWEFMPVPSVWRVRSPKKGRIHLGEAHVDLASHLPVIVPVDESSC